VSYITKRKYNQHLCDILLSPAGFANLKRILAKVAYTNPGALFKVQKKGTKTMATPFSNLWFSSTFTLGSMFRKSKTPVAKPMKQTSMVNFLSRPEQAASEAAPFPTSSKSPSQPMGVASHSALKKKKAPDSPEHPASTPEAPNGTPATPQTAPPAASRAVTPAASLSRPSRSTARSRKHKT